MNDTPRLLIVEDDPGLQSQLRWAMSEFDTAIAGNRQEALQALEDHNPEVVVLDLGLPPDPNGASEGLTTLETILELRPEVKVIIASGNEERENAVKAINLGAYDFCAKPVDIELLSIIIGRARHVHRLEIENRKLAARVEKNVFDSLVTGDPAMLEICRTVRRVATTDITVMITGESGTGKELLARAVHENSLRADKAFIAINSAAIPENLLEAELFGYEKGAFTGAVKQTVGKVEMANGGTLFLDEIGDLPLSLQAKLLRFLQDRVIERIGGRREIPVDVRIVCATNKDLEAMMLEGSFREDLFYRLNELPIDVPPLRERRDDSFLLAKYFLGEFNGLYKRAVRGFSDSAEKAIRQYPWPGNVRELENRMKKAVVMADGKVISARDLNLPSQLASEQIAPLKEVRQAVERIHISKALNATRGNISKAADLLGVSRPTLYELLKTLGIEKT
ncbi:PEP-CTERM-box response regulator transcription factor [Oceanibacterium hippocampi]|uniref:Transcriptional regulatory protein ZraR n=1 Tax=Oceanibacterium hippocampi TaxID=745714 RepID=A0A1Y5TT19_9PROT|nr:PEP-CTERM-box response regulator transcription factor [Oceanibacterium hippocampi]SLN69016.1 Transcriptional regulatory protein ZraR [Oceanibacterium hippocampi]